MNLKATLLLLLLACSRTAVCQYKNIMLDQEEGIQFLTEAPTNAINPRDSRNIVVTAASGLVYSSRDGGETWEKNQMSTASAGIGRPVVISDPKGTFYYMHTASGAADAVSGGSESTARDRVVLQKSDDGGVNWSAGEGIPGGRPGNTGNGWATTDRRGSLFVTWRQFDAHDDAGESCASNILFSMSKNGRKWADPIVISQVPGNCRTDHTSSAGAMPVVTPEGKVMIAWTNAGKIYLDRSFNGGEVWLGNDIEVAEQVGGSNIAVPGHGYCNGMPVLLTDNSKGHFRGSLYLVWADQRNGSDDTDVWFSRSHNFGDNWSAPLRINNDGKGNHQYMPWMAVDEATGYLYIVYFDRRNHKDMQTDVYLAFSVDGGASFRNVMISEHPFTPVAHEGVGFSSYITASNGVIAPVWTRADEGGMSSLWTAIIPHETLMKKPQEKQEK